MKLSVSRSLMVVALALGLASCGSKATFEIKGSIVEGQGNKLSYGPLTLTESVSGTKLVLQEGTSTFVFPGNIEYGTPFKVIIGATGPVSDAAPHEDCTVLNGDDTAGRQAAINVIVSCAIQTHNLTGTITVTGANGATKGLPTGLKLINGSDTVGFTATDASVDYAFPSIAYNQTFGLVIAAQPTAPATGPKTTCVLVPTGSLVASADKLSVSGRMGDTNAVVNVECTTG